MIIGIPKNSNPNERRTSLTPAVAEKFIRLGFKILANPDVGRSIHIPNSDYENSGVTIQADTEKLMSSADIILRLDKPMNEEIPLLKSESLYVSFLNPFSERDIINQLAEKKVNAISMELIPRTTKAQKMDALSSQASLAGYSAIIFAAQKCNKILPMQMTAAGTISPAKVFVIGAGVAGLQAIATAKRLGARVEAFDTRPTTAEQVQSLGAKFLNIDLGETSQTKDGYANELSPAQIKKQREAISRACVQADIIITTAQVFGKKAPLIITNDIIEKMKPGSVIIDTAVDGGGNVQGVQANQEIIKNGVRIFGSSELASCVALDASIMYSNNLYHVIEHCWSKEKNTLDVDPEDEILGNCLISFKGKNRFLTN